MGGSKQGREPVGWLGEGCGLLLSVLGLEKALLNLQLKEGKGSISRRESLFRTVRTANTET